RRNTSKKWMRSFDRQFPMKHAILTAIVLLASISPAPAFAEASAFAEATADRPAGQASSGPRDMYNRAMAQERALRDDATRPTVAQMRRDVASYETIIRRHPASGQCDNALWQAANLAALADERFGIEEDKQTARS